MSANDQYLHSDRRLFGNERNRRHSRLPLQAAPSAARGIVTSSRSTPSKPPSTPSRPRFASASGGKADGEPALFPIADQGSGRVGSLRGFLPRALSNACPHASPCTHGLRTRAGIEQRLTRGPVRDSRERTFGRVPSPNDCKAAHCGRMAARW